MVRDHDTRSTRTGCLGPRFVDGPLVNPHHLNGRPREAWTRRVRFRVGPAAACDRPDGLKRRFVDGTLVNRLHLKGCPREA